MVKTIITLGASFETGNLGVSALGWSSVRLLQKKWPEADIIIIGSGRSRKQIFIDIEDSQVILDNWPVRFCKNSLAKDHYWKLLFGILLVRIFPFLHSYFAKKQSTLEAICRADMIVDITGGDSFSDIYGMKRFVLGYLTKRLCQITGKPFVMLPQTYGPFKSPLARFMARRVLNKASKIYSRDEEGLEVVKGLIGDTDKLELCPDVAFILEPKVPEQPAASSQQPENSRQPPVASN